MDKMNQARSTFFAMQEFDMQTLIMDSRIYEAVLNGTALYPIFRRLRFALYTNLEQFFDDLSLKLGWNVNRLTTGEILLVADGLLISGRGSRKSNYCSCNFSIWADGIDRAEGAQSAILALAGEARITSPMVSVCWSFLTAKDELRKSYIEELLDDTLYDEAYPELTEGIGKFISDYLMSSESILVLQGKPGTGKTRLIRAILAAMAELRNEKISALYTGDKKTMENDEIFVDFVTGNDEVFIIEDADYIMRSRLEGNDNLHRFLTIADGVVRSQGRKIIFSTNLPNLADIDDALIRPGRCFARVVFRELTRAEAIKLLVRLCGGNVQKAMAIAERLPENEIAMFSLAELYRLHDQACRAENGEEVIRRISKNVGHRVGFL